MVPVDNIRSLTDFRHNAKQYVEQVQTTKSPLLLTVNGEASVVVHGNLRHSRNGFSS
ncbi:MAG: type II toxin-antitoxin system Phd/YefM family antitoxin [Cyanobacteria bacterium P01_F01_bin.150]